MPLGHHWGFSCPPKLSLSGRSQTAVRCPPSLGSDPLQVRNNDYSLNPQSHGPCLIDSVFSISECQEPQIDHTECLSCACLGESHLSFEELDQLSRTPGVRTETSKKKFHSCGYQRSWLKVSFKKIFFSWNQIATHCKKEHSSCRYSPKMKIRVGSSLPPEMFNQRLVENSFYKDYLAIPSTNIYCHQTLDK